MTFIRRGIIICVLLIIWNSIQDVHSKGLIEVFQWKQMDYYNRGDSVSGAIHNSGSSLKRPINIPPGGIIFPDQLAHINRNRGTRDIEKVTSRDNPITTNSRWGYDNPRNNTSYIPYNNVPMGATHFNGRLFVTMPRRRTGIPSTLNYIDLQKDGNDPSPKLRAYPDFETNYLNPTFEPNPNRLISVYRTSVDACNRLWFIDTGMLEYPDNRMQIQRPSIWVIDLLTDRVVHRSEIPESIAETGRGLASITVDVSKQHCDKAFAYIPDLLYSQLYVYSLENDRIWSFSHNYFNFDPVAGDLSIGGENFRWDDGIFSVTLGPMQPNGQRPVFFHAMASNNEFVVSNAVLQNEENANRSDHGDDFQLLGSRGFKKQSTMHEYDPRTGVIFYDEIQRDGVGCWNTNQRFAPDAHDTVASDPARMIYPSDLSIDDQGTMWVMTNSMPIFIYSQLDPNVVNFRVWKQNVYKAIENTKCQN